VRDEDEEYLEFESYEDIKVAEKKLARAFDLPGVDKSAVHPAEWVDEAYFAAPDPATLLEQEEAYIRLFVTPAAEQAKLKLWALWSTEAGVKARRRLERAIVLSESADVRHQRHAERLLRELASQHATWAEPRHRLSLLLVKWDARDEALKLAVEAHRLKPWHFGAAFTIADMHAQESNWEAASSWSPWLLPPLGAEGDASKSHLRSVWVQLMNGAIARRRQTLVRDAP